LTPFFVDNRIGANTVTGLGLVVLLAGLGAVLTTPLNGGMLIVGAALINL
jgi:Na+/H+-dicarboxylate symporter